MNPLFRLFLILNIILASSCATHRALEESANTVLAEKLRQNETFKEEYHYRYEGYDFVGFPNVFSPLVFPVSPAFSALPIHHGETFLEIGSGTGTLSILAALRGAKRVVALDINPHAVTNTAKNAKLHGVLGKVDARVSDVFSAIKSGEKFDVIFWNIPDSHAERQSLTLIEQATYDPGYRLLEKYLAESAAHLTKNGRLYLGYSQRPADVDRFLELASKFAWRVSLLRTAETEDGAVIALYDLRPLAS